ncbi:MAG: hypothetical protein WC721_15635 [Victivallaceae bacterium]|jgi:hypothetical protein
MKILKNLDLTKVDYDEALAQDLYECSTVDLYGHCAIGTPRIQRMLKGTLDPDGSLVCCDGRVRIQALRPFCPWQNSNAYLSEFATGFDWQPECSPIIQEQLPTLHGCVERIVNGTVPLRAKFPFIRLARLASGDFSDCNEAFSDSDRRHGKYLYKMLNLANWSSGQGNESWLRAFIDPGEQADAGASVLTYYDAKGIFNHRAEFVCWHGKIVFLYLAFFQHPDCRQPLRLYIPPDKPILFNEYMLAMNLEATVLLTDNPGLFWNNLFSLDFLILGLFGGEDEIDKFNIEALRCREVVWPLLDDGGPERCRIYERAVRVKARLARQGVNLKIAIYSNITWNFLSYNPLISAGIPYKIGKANDFHIADDAEFIRKAQSLGAHIPDILRPDRFGAVNMTDVQDETGELIESLAYAGEVTFINEFPGVNSFRFSHAVIDGAIQNFNILGTRFKPKRRQRIQVFISPGMEQRFLRQQSEESFDGWKLYVSTFMQQSGEDALTTFKGALDEFDADIVIFEVEEFFSGSANRIATAKAAINFCRQTRKGIIVVFNKGVCMTDIPSWLESTADRMVYVMPIPNATDNYIIENRSCRNHKPERFKVEFTDTGIKSSDVSDGELSKIESRPLLDKHRDVKVELEEFFNTSSPEALLSAVSGTLPSVTNK